MGREQKAKRRIKPHEFASVFAYSLARPPIVVSTAHVQEPQKVHLQRAISHTPPKEPQKVHLQHTAKRNSAQVELVSQDSHARMSDGLK